MPGHSLGAPQLPDTARSRRMLQLLVAPVSCCAAAASITASTAPAAGGAAFRSTIAPVQVLRVGPAPLGFTACALVSGESFSSCALVNPTVSNSVRS